MGHVAGPVRGDPATFVLGQSTQEADAQAWLVGLGANPAAESPPALHTGSYHVVDGGYAAQ